MARRTASAFLAATFFAAVSSGCSQPSPSLRGSEPAQTSTSVDPSPSPPVGPDLAALSWFELDRVLDQQNNETRTLLIGRLDGTLTGRVALGTRDMAEAGGQLEAFAWMAPQAAGIFDGHVLIWERPQGTAAIEAVRAADGNIASVVARVDGRVHTATADVQLRHVFFITADATGQPTGLWADSLEDPSGPTKLPYDFADEPLGSGFAYRIAASPDGSVLAVQAGLEDTTLIDVSTGAARKIVTSGQVIGLADDDLVAYGRVSPTEGREVVAVDLATGRERNLSTAVNAAQLVAGSDGPLLVTLSIDSTDTRRYQIEAMGINSGVRRVAYSQEPPELGPLLAPDAAVIGAEAPADWVLVTSSFVPFIEEMDAIRDPPEASFPLLLNLRTGATLRIGPITSDGG